MKHEEEGRQNRRSWQSLKEPGLSVVLFITAMLAVMLCFCQGAAGWIADRLVEQPEHRFGATYMTMNNPFYEVMDDEMRSVMEARGDVLITRNPALDVDKQIAQVQELIDQKVDAIFINPVDWKAIRPALEMAKEAGVPVIAVDSEVYDADMVACTVVSDNYGAGVQCAEHLLEHETGGRILLLTHEKAKSGLDRIQGFKDTIAGHDSFQILAEGDCLGQLELAMPVTTKLLASCPGTDIIMCLNDLAAMGAMAALEDAGRTGTVRVYGVDGSPDGKSMIEEQIMTATAAQFPRKIGRAAAETVYRVLEQEPVKPVVQVPTELVTYENLSRYGSDGWQ